MIERDYIFEFAGMPKSGKTTILSIVLHYLKRKGFHTQDYHGGGRHAPIDKSSIGSLNLYLASEAVEFILTAREREKEIYKLFFMDRGIFDRCIFTNALVKMGRIDPEEARTTLDYLSLPSLVRSLDGVFLFLTSPKLSLEREYKGMLIQKEGRVMNTSFLSYLRDTSIELAKTMQDKYPYVKILDTEELDGKPAQCASIIINNILNIMGVKDASYFILSPTDNQ